MDAGEFEKRTQTPFLEAALSRLPQASCEEKEGPAQGSNGENNTHVAVLNGSTRDFPLFP